MVYHGNFFTWVGAKFLRLYRNSGSPNMNQTLDFAQEVAKYLKLTPKTPQIAQNGDLHN